MEPDGVTRALVMSDVAALAGVSHQTVSRVVNGHPNVAPQTRERVERAIAELGYRPNIAARALVTGSTRTIGLVTVKMLPFDNKSEFQVMVDMPEGTALETTARVASSLAMMRSAALSSRRSTPSS